MAFPHEVIASAMGQGLSILVIGGQALPAFGVVRQTLDLDCLIAADDLGRLDGLLRAAGYAATDRTPIFARYRHPDATVEDVVLLLVDRETLMEISSRARSATIGGEGLRVPRLDDLISLKLHAMRNSPARFLRDTADIADLLRANPGAVSPDELRSLCETYGPAGVIEALEKRR
jgi:hypothetical protein